jgi:FtsP/CotA-like multicopper oxidase with cupredoxin domain
MTPGGQPFSRRGILIGAAAATTHLGLPPRAEAQPVSDGFVELRARPVRPFRGARAAASTMGYEGTVPGPTLRIKRGADLRVRLFNDLAEPTSVHWHGVRVPNPMDGVPSLTQPPVVPGTSFDYRFRPPDAGTFWYHAPGAAQLDQGLHGALIVEEAEPVQVDRDVALVLATPGPEGGSLPPALVNGTALPAIAARSGDRLRLRLINATAARGLVLRLEGHAPWVMAIDGQPSEPFLARDGRVGLGPGSRVDLFVDTMQDPGSVAQLVAGDRAEPIVRLIYDSGAGTRAARRSDPLALPPNPLPARIDLKSSLKAEMALAGAKSFEPSSPPLFVVKRGRAVTLAVRNTSGRSHVIHVHGHSFRLLDRLDDGWKPYWMDTLVVGDQVERIAFVADNPGKWLVESRPLEQTGDGAGAWFLVS